MARRVIFIVVSFMIFIVLLAQTVMAQSTTPTPAPSKTPTLAPTATPEATLEIETPESLPETNLGFESFVQADLSVLTGNVQRPNGIVWLDGRLYISCTGDWSIYQVEFDSGSTELYIFGLRNAHALYAETDDI